MTKELRICGNHEIVISKDCAVSDCVICQLLDERDEFLGSFRHIIQYLETSDSRDRTEPPASYIRTFVDHVLKQREQRNHEDYS
jgi:hypothetical protein